MDNTLTPLSYLAPKTGGKTHIARPNRLSLDANGTKTCVPLCSKSMNDVVQIQYRPRDELMCKRCLKIEAMFATS